MGNTGSTRSGAKALASAAAAGDVDGAREVRGRGALFVLFRRTKSLALPSVLHRSVGDSARHQDCADAFSVYLQHLRRGVRLLVRRP